MRVENIYVKIQDVILKKGKQFRIGFQELKNEDTKLIVNKSKKIY